ncbi:hypothetical protein GQX74_006382 [Glossina fuscipes]|nr:hypothetical protein GQX74_006382 [Glossina fuscipes]
MCKDFNEFINIYGFRLFSEFTEWRLCVPLALKIFQHSSSAFSSRNSYLLKFHYCLARTIDYRSAGFECRYFGFNGYRTASVQIRQFTITATIKQMMATIVVLLIAFIVTALRGIIVFTAAVSKTPLALPGGVVISPLFRSSVLRIIPSRKDAPLAALLSYSSRALLMSCPDNGLAIGLGAFEEFVVVLPTPAPPTGTFPTALANVVHRNNFPPYERTSHLVAPPLPLLPDYRDPLTAAASNNGPGLSPLRLVFELLLLLLQSKAGETEPRELLAPKVDEVPATGVSSVCNSRALVFVSIAGICGGCGDGSGRISLVCGFEESRCAGFGEICVRRGSSELPPKSLSTLLEH